MRTLTDFMGQVFEDICVQWLWSHNDTDSLPFLILDAGRWWGANPATRSQEEIDIVASGEDPKTMLFCECKWRSVPSGLQQLEVLRNRAKLLHPKTSHYMLFSKSGFDEHVTARAAQDDAVTLIDFAHMG